MHLFGYYRGTCSLDFIDMVQNKHTLRRELEGQTGEPDLHRYTPVSQVISRKKIKARE